MVGSCVDTIDQDGVMCGEPLDLAIPNYPIPHVPVGRICSEATVGQFVQIMNANDPQNYGLSEVKVFGVEGKSKQYYYTSLIFMT